MPISSWDLVVGTLGGVLDPKIVTSCLKPNGAGDKGLPLTAKMEMWYSMLKTKHRQSSAFQMKDSL